LPAFFFFVCLPRIFSFKGSKLPIFDPKPWSNPSGAILSPVVDDVWAAERPFVWNGIDVGGRMTVIRLGDGSLWVHSPVALDADLRKAIDALGPVRHIISPNYEHVKYAPDWIAAYPTAIAYACPGLRELKPHILFTDTVSGEDGKNCWSSSADKDALAEIETCWIDCEKNPFTGKPFFNEVVFYHRPSKTLLVTDIYWNYPDSNEIPFGTKVWKFGMDKVYLPFYKRLMVTNRNALQIKLEKIIAWDFQQIIPLRPRKCSGPICLSKFEFERALFLQHCKLYIDCFLSYMFI